MDQPFQPNLYFHMLRQRWPLIVIPTVVALLVAIVLSALMPVRYTATATLLAPKPQLVWRWDNRVYDVVDLRFDWRAEVMPLLMTENLARRALDKVGDQLDVALTPDQLLAATKTKQGNGSLFTLSVRAASAHDAALLANAMAEALPEAVADYYGGEQDQYDQALAEVETQFQELDQQLLDFRGRTGISLGFNGEITARGDDELFGAHSAIKQELTLKNSYRAALQTAIDRIDLVLQNAETSGILNITLLDIPELKIYGYDYPTLQTLLDQQGQEALIETLRRLRERINTDKMQLDQSAIATQYETAQQLQQMDTILRDRGVWQESLVSLKRKQVELQMKRVIEGARVKIVDPAPVPSAPSQPKWLFNLFVAGLSGFLGGLLLAVAAVYLRESYS
ncbi:MAG: hypothetical protein GXP38_01285 [Chloroflexi bacterium]|nr:hypothetical protein [Chloroflexota bacterium]